MKLAGAVIRSSDEALPVLDGKIRSFYLDRRNAREEVRAGMAARRRKPPSELRSLVGTGQLCVAKGEFQILEADVKRYRPGGSMRLEVMDTVMYISHLSHAVARDGVQRWEFAALFIPSEEQKRWVLNLHTVGGTQPSAPVKDPTLVTPALRPAPVFMKQQLDTQLEFLRSLAQLDEVRSDRES